MQSRATDAIASAGAMWSASRTPPALTSIGWRSIAAALLWLLLCGIVARRSVQALALKTVDRRVSVRSLESKRRHARTDAFAHVEQVRTAAGSHSH